MCYERLIKRSTAIYKLWLYFNYILKHTGTEVSYGGQLGCPLQLVHLKQEDLPQSGHQPEGEGQAQYSIPNIGTMT